METVDGPERKNEGFPPERLDLFAMNRVIRHRLRNLCAGGKMTVERVAAQTARDLPSVAERCAALGAEFDSLRTFTERMDLIFDRLPSAASMALFDLLRDCRERFVRKFPFCALDMDGPERPVTIRGGSLVQIALTELLYNAGEAAGLDGQVSFRWETPSDQGLLFRVADTGPAIPAEIPIAPPSPFHTTRGRHDGLGLTIAHRVAESLGGSLTVAANAENHVEVVMQLPPEEMIA